MQAQTLKKVVVLDFPADPSLKANVIPILNDFMAGAVRDSGFSVISSADIAASLGLERQRQLLGCAGTSCMAEIGGALGSDYVVRGNVAVLDEDTALTVVLSDAKGTVLKQSRQRVKGKSSSELVTALEKLIPELMGAAR